MTTKVDFTNWYRSICKMFKRKSNNHDLLNRNIMLDYLNREIMLLSHRKNDWSIASDDDLRTLKKAYQILTKGSRS